MVKGGTLWNNKRRIPFSEKLEKGWGVRITNDITDTSNTTLNEANILKRQKYKLSRTDYYESNILQAQVTKIEDFWQIKRLFLIKKKRVVGVRSLLPILLLLFAHEEL